MKNLTDIDRIKSSYILSLLLCLCLLFISSYTAAFLTWMGVSVFERGLEFFTVPRIGWGTTNHWYEQCNGMALMGQLFASPGLLVYLFLTVHFWRKGHNNIGRYFFSAAGLAGINGAIFLPLFHGLITLLFVLVGSLTGLLYYSLLVLLLGKIQKK